MGVLLFFLLLLIPLSTSGQDNADIATRPRYFETYGVDLRSCEEAMCWASSECGGKTGEKMTIVDTSFDARCRNVVYVRRHTAYSISVEVIWEKTDMTISMQPSTVSGNTTGKDLFVCSSRTSLNEKGEKVATLGMAITTSDKFVLYQRAAPPNLRIPDEPVTYCKFDLKIRSKIGSFMKAHNLTALCVFVKEGSDPKPLVKCMNMRNSDQYYNKFNANKQFKDKVNKVYTVFLVAFSMFVMLLVLPIYHAIRESFVNFRYMRAYFRFRKTLTELPEEEIERHRLKNKKGNYADPIAALIAQAEEANKETQEA